MKRKHRWPMVFGLLAAGAAVGATGALVAKRRRSAMAWDDYDNVPAVDDMGLAEPERQTFADERSQSG